MHTYELRFKMNGESQYVRVVKAASIRTLRKRILTDYKAQLSHGFRIEVRKESDPILYGNYEGDVMKAYDGNRWYTYDKKKGVKVSLIKNDGTLRSIN